METNSKFENIRTEIYENSKLGSKEVADEIAAEITKNNELGKNTVLGFATGSSPLKVYEELIRIHTKEGLSFKNVITFNLDEYYPMDKKSIHSYYRFMYENFFDDIDILPENINIPDGSISANSIKEYCDNYEKKIQDAGGLDIQLLGIGRTGHIGFNEPGSSLYSNTRLITLDSITRLDAASDFFGKENVPRTAITMGIGSIMKAKKILLLAWGEGKAQVIQKTIEGGITDLIPATYLQDHSNTEIILDKAAAAELVRVKSPWLTGSVEWTEKPIKQAVVWLCQYLNKPILKLLEEEYNENGLSELLALHGPAYDINIKIFNDLQHTITGWPGGKPDADDSQRPERAKPFPKRVLIFSPHPGNDVISMGGTLLRLVDQGHEVHVAYQTSGNIAVFDDYAYTFMDFVHDFFEKFQIGDEKLPVLYWNILEFIQKKKAGQTDSEDLQNLKGMIRRIEAKAACRFCNIEEKNIHFLDMPFYETGKVKKKPIGPEDINIVKQVIEQIQPHQIYAAGDLSDPHGTHRVCLDAILTSFTQLNTNSWAKDTKLWLYRGAWQEWGIGDIEMAVPLSPTELLRKRRAIFKHQSQKDSALFPGHDSREFWQRAEDRNKGTAKFYDQLGLAEYEAIEAFVEWKK